MRLLIADAFPETIAHAFAPLGLEVEIAPQLGADDIPKAIGNATILIVRSTKVTRAAIEAGKNLELIIRAGAGVDNIDVAAASERGIYVANCPGKNSVAVAELTMALLLALDRRVPNATSDLRAGKWNKKEYSKADGLKGKTLGILGLGAIGKLVAKRAQAFDMRVICFNVPPILDEEAAELDIESCASPSELAEKSDVVSVHVPGSADTKSICGAVFFAKMKPGTIFINTSRGSIHDETALLVAMQSKGLRVGLDVFANEPAAGVAELKSEIASMPNFVGTPHVGASTEQAQNAIATECVRICREFVTAGVAPNVVNIERHSSAKTRLIVRHFDKVGVLANVLGIIRNHGANVEQMTNTMFEGAKTAVAVIRLSATPDQKLLDEIAQLEGQVIQVDVKGA
ncbi:MAG: NAD(P)-dependent oxidoreductase [Polyangiaceae bacterium]